MASDANICSTPPPLPSMTSMQAPCASWLSLETFIPCTRRPAGPDIPKIRSSSFRAALRCFGCTYCQQLNFIQEKVERLAQARFVFSDPSWKTVSAAGKEFVRGLLKKQPGFRWTAREALDHCADVWGPTFLVRSDPLESWLSVAIMLSCPPYARASISCPLHCGGRARFVFALHPLNISR